MNFMSVMAVADYRCCLEMSICYRFQGVVCADNIFDLFWQYFGFVASRQPSKSPDFFAQTCLKILRFVDLVVPIEVPNIDLQAVSCRISWENSRGH